MIAIRYIVLACGLVSVFGVAGGAAQTPVASELTKATSCATHMPTVFTGGATVQSTIQLNNDGGWCWFDFQGVQGTLRYAPTYRVSAVPTHGELTMGEVNKKTRVAYRPRPGFSGMDEFEIVNTMNNNPRRVIVTVTP